MNIEDSRIIARFQCLLTESLVAKRLAQWRPELKDALYQMFEELEQRDLKETPEYRNVMLRADQHAEWLAGLARFCGLALRTKRREDVTQVDGILGVSVEVGARRKPWRGYPVDHCAVAQHGQVEAVAVEG